MPTSTATSRATASGLWAVVADVTSWPAHLPTFRAVTHSGGPSPLGIGARYDVRQPGLAAATYEVTVVDPGRSFAWVARSPGVVSTAVHSVTAQGEGSRLDLSLEWSGPLAGLVRRLLGGRAARMIELEATTLARVAESTSRSG